MVTKEYLIQKVVYEVSIYSPHDLKEVTMGYIEVQGKLPASRINAAMKWCACNYKKTQHQEVVYTLIGEKPTTLYVNRFNEPWDEIIA